MDPNGGTNPAGLTGAGIATAERVVAGRYRIEATLGHGGMGEVFLAFDLHLRRQVALKKPRTGAALDERALARFGREARAAALLSHPSVVAVHDIVRDGDTPFIVMELVHGEPLSEVLRRAAPLPVDRALDIAEAVAGALAYAHGMRVVHRDVKPANVMITAAGGVKVLDFGVARYLAEATPADTRLPFGTPEYLSPEQIRGDAVDGRSDLYALGCVLSEMLTGRPPFAGDAVAVVYRHLEEAPSAPSSSNPRVPAAVDAIVRRCLSKDPEGRFGSAAELEAELRRVRGAGGAGGAGGGAAAGTTRVPDVRAVAPPSASGRSQPATRVVFGSPTSVIPAITDARRVIRIDGSRRRRRPFVPVLAVTLTLLVLAGAFAFAWTLTHPTAAASGPPKAKPHPLILHPPTGVKASGACDGFLRFKASLSWIPTASPRADGYAIYRDEGSGGALRLVGRVQGRFATGFVEHDLGSAATYRYEVRAMSGAKVGPPSPASIAATPLFCMS